MWIIHIRYYHVPIPPYNVINCCKPEQPTRPKAKHCSSKQMQQTDFWFVAWYLLQYQLALGT